ncbi:hypothetical protein K435DRAFT_793900 [Dendrothele bispora CBS 962.96]|uniref:Uncharacterized protein n=1 Tax=Dendrothele bispora (strain CBS 962.96) TaxID=1314807 RepID=A0A4S8MDP0_DENBC|nr:hypothetical protein K435DRAFT_793900 [Dendrothele bispora CBS 962.96]
MNPLLDIAGLDPTQDTPVEILHTILLGIIKYVWYMFHTSLSDAQKNLFVIRLQSTDLDGLTVPPLRAAYIMQYRQNLIGKHFKTLMQTMVFHVHDLVTPEQFVLIKAVGDLAAVLWVSEIDDMEKFLKDLEVLIGNALDAFAAIDPSKITKKVKLHLLPHLVSDIRRFGPAVRNSTEVFECFNAIFRMCSIYSNHQAPSRDIARKFASMSRMKHIISGGFWLEGGKWIQASLQVRQVIMSDPVVQRHLGWVAPNVIRYGEMKSLAHKKTISRPWSSTQAATVLRGMTWKIWNDNSSVVAQSGDVCKIGSWVAVRQDGSTEFMIGRIIELLSPTVEDNGPSSIPDNLVTIEQFLLGENRHPDFDMPVLRKSDPITYIVTKTKERIETGNTVSVMVHGDDSHFVINLHGLHNAALIRRLLPRDLTAPSAIHADREAWHNELAIEVRSILQDKRKVAQEKRTETTRCKSTF